MFGDDEKAVDDNEAQSPSHEASEVTLKKKSIVEPKPLTVGEEISDEKPKEKNNNVAEIIKKRKEKLAELAHVFLYSEVLEGDDAVRPMIHTPKINDDKMSDEFLVDSESDSEPMNADEENNSPSQIPLCEPSPSAQVPKIQIKTEVPQFVDSPKITETGLDDITVKDEV